MELRFVNRMKIYFDNCSLQRPLDDQTQPRIEQETKAVVAILAACETGDLTLISSEILLAEVAETFDLERREMTLGVLDIAEETIVINRKIEERAREIEKFGIKAMDALHLASAETGRAEYFCTCDDKLLKRARAKNDLKTKAVSPIELFEEITK
jgi:predicted nucleic acid-binding protein